MIINVPTPSADYVVKTGSGILAAEAKELFAKKRVCIVTDTGVPAQYAETVAAGCKSAEIFRFPQGEASKCAKTYLDLLQFMLDHGFDRSDCVAAVGGGVCGDLAGFAASTYMRGVDFYNFPTTLLSQVDSSVGGKTAIDFGGVKNSVGAFWQPRRVTVDTDTLRTLDCRQVACGMAEIIKIAAIFDKDLFESLEAMPAGEIPDEKIIARAIELKRNVVVEDERDKGLRKVLNFGHTIGHGIEAAAEGKLLHGECVALGMLAMCRGEVRERVRRLTGRSDLPCEKIDFVRIDDVMEVVTLDKKSEAGTITAIWLDEIGKFSFIAMSHDRLRELTAEIVKEA